MSFLAKLFCLIFFAVSFKVVAQVPQRSDSGTSSSLSIEAELKEHDRLLNDAAKAEMLARVEVEKLKQARDKAKTEYQIALEAHKEDAGGFTIPIINFSIAKGEGASTKNALADAEKKLNLAEGALRSAEPKVQLLSLKTEELTGKVNKLSETAVKKENEDKNRLQEANKALISAMKADRLTSRFENLKTQVGSIDNYLNSLSTQLDQMYIGEYLKDKVGLLLNSQLICNAYQRCKVPEVKKIPNDEIEKALFPNTKKSTRQESYYDKSHSSK